MLLASYSIWSVCNTMTEIQDGCQLATLSRMNAKIAGILRITVLHNTTRFDEHLLNTFCVILLKDEQTNKPAPAITLPISRR